MNENFEVIDVDINLLKPAKHNPRLELKPGMKEYERIYNSIKRFGYVDLVIINKDMTIIGGHQRVSVLKDLGYKQIKVIQVDIDKTKEKALNIALNKISGEWNEEMLEYLLRDLGDEDFDLELTGFELDELDEILNSEIDDDEQEEKENARINTVKGYNLDIYDPYNVDGQWDMPVIYCDNYIPKRLIGFNYALTSKDKDTGIHMFIDDYQFERLWNSPEKYIDVLKQYEVILSPDFSLYIDMPMAMKLWNVYRSRLLGQYWQQNAIRVIPTISWAEEATFDFCFDGIEKHSIVAISTIGVKRQDNAYDVWKKGVDAMIEHIQPRTILVYGGKVEYDYPNCIEVIYFDNEVTERMKN